jgi:hypothetical protein
MLLPNLARACLFCGKSVRGRSDKKFCGDYCRASHNNELKGPVYNQMRIINYALCKNRRILERMLMQGLGNSKVHRDTLLENGFLFKYHTHVRTTKKGRTCFYCYDHGYLPVEKNWYQLIKEKEAG